MLPVTLLLTVLLAADPEVNADVVIIGATIHDGAGKPGRKGDVAIKGDRIVAVGDFKVAGTPQKIDGAGLIVAPGFIDLHTHSDNELQEAKTKANLCYLTQGCTTVVTGNCGFGPTDVARYFETLEKNGVGSNVIHQVPHNGVRQKVMKNANRAPSADELKQMETLVDEGMKAGAWSLSTGLIYNPGTYARTDEIIALAKVAAKHGGFYASHIRSEGPDVLTALEEALKIGREAGLPVHISHMKTSGKTAWPRMADAIALVEAARGRGQVVTADQYPYPASSTSLAAMVIPAQFREGTQKDLVARFDDPEQGKKVRQGILKKLEYWQGGQPIRIAQYKVKPAWEGKDLAQLAEQEKKPVLDIVLEIERQGGAAVVVFGMSEENVRLTMKQPFVPTASDGASKVPGSDKPHPRSYGCFPRKIGRYAIEDKVLPVEQAIRSASGLPADILRLKDRGYIRPGYYADVVVFDPKTFRDRATYEDPHQYSTGVRYLFVNGKLVIKDEKFQDVLSGKVLRHGMRE
jgi:N-acyl-D-aspartate/D-glutamate deacylase